MALKVACPKCRHPLQITQALPAKIQCPSCRKVFTASAPRAAGQAIAPRPRQTPQAQPAVAHPAGIQQPPQQAYPQSTMAMPADNQIVSSYARRKNSSMGIMLAVLGVVAFLMIGVAGVAAFVIINNSPNNKKNDIAKYDDFDEPPVIPGGGNKFDARVDESVKLGVTYLKKRILGPKKLYYFVVGGKNDPHVGATALAALTLLECDVPYTDLAVQKAIKTVHDSAPTLKFTYSVALSILFLDRLTAVKDMPDFEKQRHKQLIKKFALQLIAAQQPAMERDGQQTLAGGWAYLCQNLDKNEEARLLQQLKNKTFRPGHFKVLGQFQFNYRDNSIGQFVTLALWNARKHDVPVAQTLITEELRYLDEQKANGSWTYSVTVNSARDATTCAGLIGLAIGRAIRDEIDNPKKKNGQQPAKKQAPAEQKADVAKLGAKINLALNFIGRKIGVPERKWAPKEKAGRHFHTMKLEELQRQYLEGRQVDKQMIALQIKRLDNDELATGIIIDADAWGDLYFLWSVERVAVIYGLDSINGRDWYGWGKDIILKHQVRDENSDYHGAWKERFPGVPDTCFALLFLKRANVVKDLSDKLKELMQTAGIQAAPPQRGTPPRRDA